MKYKPTEGYLYIKLKNKKDLSEDYKAVKAEVVASYSEGFGVNKFEEGTEIIIPIDSLLAEYNDTYSEDDRLYIIDERSVMGVLNDSDSQDDEYNE